MGEPACEALRLASPALARSWTIGGRGLGPVASVVGVQPSVEHAHHVIETVTVADGDESLTAADSAWASQGLECGEGRLRLREHQPSLGTQPGVPARCCSLERHGSGRTRATAATGVRERNLRNLKYVSECPRFGVPIFASSRRN
jgi:hypothetical protein